MVDVANAAVVAVLTRAPSFGGKSRLFAAFGRLPDPALLTALLLDTLDGAAVPGAIRVVAVEPPHGCEDVRALVPADVIVIPQDEGTLGERMRALMAHLFERGARMVALVGSDLPELQPRLIGEAFTMLERDPEVLVLGPATDGGYYLIAAAAVPNVFAGIEWGGSRVLAETLAAAARRHTKVALLDPLSDVDSVGDLQRLVDGGASHAGSVSRTCAWARSNGIVRSENLPRGQSRLC